VKVNAARARTPHRREMRSHGSVQAARPKGECTEGRQSHAEQSTRVAPRGSQSLWSIPIEADMLEKREREVGGGEGVWWIKGSWNRTPSCTQLRRRTLKGRGAATPGAARGHARQRKPRVSGKIHMRRKREEIDEEPRSPQAEGAHNRSHS